MSCRRSISLSLTANYAPSWKTWEGVREFVQNWHDGTLASLENTATGSTRVDFTKDDASYHGVTRCGGAGVTVGSIVYCKKTQCLTLVNYSTALKRKVLLLGYSEKAVHHDVIGQFGEGLKVGALALLRSGREVAMLTSHDSWRFQLARDPMFEENVLTVYVSDRGYSQDSVTEITPMCPMTIGEGDTCVQIWPMTTAEWNKMAQKFLFLEPPTDSVHTELGTLLLDSHLQGQLFVKQVWVSDQRKDGLFIGVNFRDLRIDRDRRAVVHQSDIDHQVSTMWIRALKLRPDLVSRYYELLQENSCCDVRHASYYLDDVAIASLLATEFFRRYGANAVPVLNSSVSQTLHLLSKELEEKRNFSCWCPSANFKVKVWWATYKVVLCNKSLLEILQRSGRVRSAESILEKKDKKRNRVPFEKLGNEQLSVVGHALELVKVVFPEITTTSIDIYEGSENTVTMTGDKFEVPFWMTDTKAVHEKSHCKSGLDKKKECHCAAAFVCERIVTAFCNVKCIGCEQKGIHHVIAALASQVCGKLHPFCQILHKPKAREHLLEKREQELLENLDKLMLEFQNSEENHKQELALLKNKLSCLEKQQSLDEVKFVDMEQALIRTFRKEYEVGLKAKQTEYDSLYSEFLSKSAELQQSKRQVTELTEQVDEERERHEKHTQGLRAQSEWYLKRLADRVSKLSELHCARRQKDPELSEVARLLHCIAREFEDDQKKDLCLICASNSKNCVILPCRHHHTCLSCAQIVPKCPVCRGVIQQRIQVFN